MVMGQHFELLILSTAKTATFTQRQRQFIRSASNDEVATCLEDLARRVRNDEFLPLLKNSNRLRPNEPAIEITFRFWDELTMSFHDEASLETFE